MRSSLPAAQMLTRHKRKATRETVAAAAAAADSKTFALEGSAAKRPKWEALGRLSQMPTALLAKILTEFLTFNTALTRVLPLSRSLFAAVRAMRFRFLSFFQQSWGHTDPTDLCTQLTAYDLRCLQRYGPFFFALSSPTNGAVSFAHRCRLCSVEFASRVPIPLLQLLRDRVRPYGPVDPRAGPLHLRIVRPSAAEIAIIREMTAIRTLERTIHTASPQRRALLSLIAEVRSRCPSHAHPLGMLCPTCSAVLCPECKAPLCPQCPRDSFLLCSRCGLQTHRGCMQYCGFCSKSVCTPCRLKAKSGQPLCQSCGAVPCDCRDDACAGACGRLLCGKCARSCWDCKRVWCRTCAPKSSDPRYLYLLSCPDCAAAAAVPRRREGIPVRSE
jgi:hypothetical protein